MVILNLNIITMKNDSTKKAIQILTKANLLKIKGGASDGVIIEDVGGM